MLGGINRSVVWVDPGQRRLKVTLRASVGLSSGSIQVTVGLGLPSARQNSTTLLPSMSSIIVVHMLMRAARSSTFPARYTDHTHTHDVPSHRVRCVASRCRSTPHATATQFSETVQLSFIYIPEISFPFPLPFPV